MKRFLIGLLFSGLLGTSAHATVINVDGQLNLYTNNKITCIHSIEKSGIVCFKIVNGEYSITPDQLELLKTFPNVEIHADFVIDYSEGGDGDSGSGNGSGNNNGNGNAANNGSGNGSGNTIIIALPGSTVIVREPKPAKVKPDE